MPLARDVVADLTTNSLDMIPAYLRQAAFWGMNKLNNLSKFMVPYNTIITNVPGPVGMNKKYFAGAEIMNIYPLVPIANGTAITHGITGIYNLINLGVLADRAVIGDMDFYIQCMEESTQEFRDQVKKLKPENKKTKAAPKKP
ncbi:MAG TPA: DUF1298 domain-containing protein [Porticoccus sp.]|nr:DUF1298 domain-containing protein [Porticoccus sp.]